MTFRPKLRAGLVVTGAGEGDAIHDPVFGRRVNIGRVSRALVKRLDGSLEVEALVAEVAAELAPDVAAATVEHTLRTLLLMNLVDGAGTAILSRAVAVRTGRVPFEPLLLEESRFQCQGSGGCCQNYSFGPLTDEDVARIERLDVAAAYPALGPGPYLEDKVATDGQTYRFLKSTDERCVFLLPDRRCGIHAAFGAEHKPNLCRLYPLTSEATIDGLKIYDHGECGSFATSARSGPSLRSDLPRVRALMPAEVTLHHPIVFLGPGTPCDYGHLLRVQTAMCDLVAARIGSTGETVRALATLLRGFVDELNRCPLAPAEPDLTIDRLLARAPASFYDGAPGAREPLDFSTVATIAAALLRLVAPAIVSASPSVSHVLSARLAREFGLVARIVEAVARNRLDPIANPLDPYYRQVAEIPVDDPEIDEVLRISLRQQLFAHRLLIDERPVAGMARIAFAHAMTLFGAKLSAASSGAAGVGLADLSAGHMLAHRLLRQARAASIFVEHEPQSWALIDAASSLA